MVATRSSARKVQGEPAAPANTLKAPPKRAARRRTEPETATEPEPVPVLRPVTRRSQPAVGTATKAAPKRAAKSTSKTAAETIDEEPIHTVTQPDARSVGRPVTKRATKPASAPKPTTRSSAAPAAGLTAEPVVDILAKPLTSRPVAPRSRQPAKDLPNVTSIAASKPTLRSAPKMVPQAPSKALEEEPWKRVTKAKVPATSDKTTTAPKRATRSTARKTETRLTTKQKSADKEAITATTQDIDDKAEVVIQSATETSAAVEHLVEVKTPDLRAMDVSPEPKGPASEHASVNVIGVVEIEDGKSSHKNPRSSDDQPATIGAGDEEGVLDTSEVRKIEGDEAGGHDTDGPAPLELDVGSPIDAPLADEEVPLQKLENETTSDEKMKILPCEDERGAQKDEDLTATTAVQQESESHAPNKTAENLASPPKSETSDRKDSAEGSPDTESSPSPDGNNAEQMEQEACLAAPEPQPHQRLEQIEEQAAGSVLDQCSPPIGYMFDEDPAVTPQAKFLPESVVEDSKEAATTSLTSTGAFEPSIPSVHAEIISSADVPATDHIVDHETLPLDVAFVASLNPETGPADRVTVLEYCPATGHGRVSPKSGIQSLSTDEKVVSGPVVPSRNTETTGREPDNDDTVFSSPKPNPSLLAVPIPALSFRAGSILPRPDSPIKSAMKSPKKCNDSPKKNVTFNTHPSSPSQMSLLVNDGPLSKTVFYLDVNSRGKSENHIFLGLLEDLGARVIPEWDSQYTAPTHCLFKDGSTETLQKVKATKGAVKCVNVGFVLDCEKFNKRVDESDYSVSLLPVDAQTPSPAPKRIAYTPARTPSRLFEFRTPSTMLSTPTTPNSSEWERSVVYDDGDDKENSAPSPPPRPVQKSCPPKAQANFSWLSQSPVKPMTSGRPLLSSAARKRRFETFGGITMAPPKKPRFL